MEIQFGSFGNSTKESETGNYDNIGDPSWRPAVKNNSNYMGGSITSQTDDVEMSGNTQCSSTDNIQNIKRYGSFTYEKEPSPKRVSVIIQRL